MAQPTGTLDNQDFPYPVTAETSGTPAAEYMYFILPLPQMPPHWATLGDIAKRHNLYINMMADTSAGDALYTTWAPGSDAPFSPSHQVEIDNVTAEAWDAGDYPETLPMKMIGYDLQCGLSGPDRPRYAPIELEMHTDASSTGNVHAVLLQGECDKSYGHTPTGALDVEVIDRDTGAARAYGEHMPMSSWMVMSTAHNLNKLLYESRISISTIMYGG